MRVLAWMTGGWMTLVTSHCGGGSNPPPVIIDADADTDSPGFCGDGVCSADEGEGCTTCPADCDTTAPVCGNGACDPGELGVCEADCGPNPWPTSWENDAFAAFDEINALRAVGGVSLFSSKFRF